MCVPVGCCTTSQTLHQVGRISCSMLGFVQKNPNFLLGFFLQRLFFITATNENSALQRYDVIGM